MRDDRGAMQLASGESGQIVLQEGAQTFDGSNQAVVDCSLDGTGEQVELTRIVLNAIQVESLS